MLAAGEVPDARQLLERSTTALRQFKSYQFESEMVIDMTMGDRPMKMTFTTTTAAVNPDRQRIETKSQMGATLIVSDGEFTYTYLPALKQYTKKAAIQGPEAALAGLGISVKKMHQDLSDASRLARVVREESDSWVVEMKVDRMALPAPPGAQLTSATIVTWVDKTLGVTRQMTMEGTMTMAGMANGIPMRQRMTFRDYKIDQPIPASTFVFTPPDGATEVPELAGRAKPAMTGKPAPLFEAKSLDGRAFSNAALKGKVVLLDFWATWCAPCRKEVPFLEKLAAEYRDKGLVVIAMNAGEDRETVSAFLKSAKLTIPVVLTADTEIQGSFAVTAFPTYVLIGRDGNVAAYQVGAAGEEKLRESIETEVLQLWRGAAGSLKRP